MQWRDLLLVMNLGTASTMKVWFQNFTILLIGLSKERPILGDHTKAHIFGLRSENTPTKPRRSTTKSTTKDHLQGIITLCFYFCEKDFPLVIHNFYFTPWWTDLKGYPTSHLPFSIYTIVE